ncbi:thrombomodulin [Anoplopoma fimbria]|uniref:thrombomodulin n=1 Tax=Anoplopoma fimbria TaxID=229290 RepID=UPI0023EBB5C6|nr:thrombomodulin [Anoplopoma fimbria]
MREGRFLQQTSLWTDQGLTAGHLGSTMRDETGLCVFLLALLVGRAGGMEPSTGYCVGTRCFTVHHHASDFTAAQQQCGGRDGHLMTLRSSGAHDILSLLVGNFTGRFWIGLHLETGCPDPDVELKGYQWVTDDTQSDLSNWGTGFDGSCSSGRCVSVSQQDQFQWIQNQCGGDSDGFLCEYSFRDPCKGLGVGEGESVIYTTPMGFTGEDLLSLPPGSTAVRVPTESKYVCFTERWLEAPWSCEIDQGGCEYRCAVTPKQHLYTCYCPTGRTVNAANRVTCEEADEHEPCAALRCAHVCYRDGDGGDGAYACMCLEGFKLAGDGRSCVEVDHCGDARQCPGEHYLCVNSVGAFQCVCDRGYEPRSDLCVDVDECVSAPCEHVCSNTPGSYQCSCYDGYQQDQSAPHRCRLHCGDEECVAECDPNIPSQCYCPDGYVSEEREDHTVCIDINECVAFYCDQDCRNTFGSYVCACSAGYTLMGEYRCVKDEDGDGEEGSGEATTTRSSPGPGPGPTRRPSSVSAGGLAGIIVCTVFLTLLVVFLAHRVLSSRQEMEMEMGEEEEEEEEVVVRSKPRRMKRTVYNAWGVMLKVFSFL